MFEIYKPFGEIALPLIPDDLADLVNRLEIIKRYVNDIYPQGVFDDNDKDHEVRLVAYASLSIIQGVDQEKLTRILWVHDLVELETGDVVAPIKDTNHKLANDLAEAESIAAKKLLSPEDENLFHEFNNASDFLKGKPCDLNTISPESLIAAVLDRIDGNMFFHFSITKWILGGNNHPNFINENPFEHGFKQRRTFLKNLERIKDRFPQTVELCEFLLDKQIEYVASVWSNVPKELWPEKMKSQPDMLKYPHEPS